MSEQEPERADGAGTAAAAQPVAVVETDGVVLEKRLREVDEGVWQLRFDLQSDRNDTVAFRLADPLPTGFPLERVGFHEAFGKRNWCIEDGRRVVHETTVGPRGSYLTIYAVRTTDDVKPAAFTAQPTLEVTTSEDDANATNLETMNGNSQNGEQMEPSEMNASTGGPSDEEIAARIAMAEQEIEEPGFEVPSPPTDDSPTDDSPTDDSPTDEVELVDDEDSPALELHDPTEDVDDDSFADAEPEAFASDPVDGTDDAPAPDAHETPSSDEAATQADANRTSADEQGEVAQSRVGAIAAELREGAVPDEDLDALRKELLGSSMRGHGSLDARMRHVEQELNELAAYKEAMASFLDEHGDGRDLLQELDDRTSQTATELESVKNAVSGLDARVDDVADQEELEAELDGLADGLTALQTDRQTAVARIESNAEQLEDISRKLDAVRDEHGGEVDDLEADLATLSNDVEEIRGWHRQFADLFSELTAATPRTDGNSGEASGSSTDDRSAPVAGVGDGESNDD